MPDLERDNALRELGRMAAERREDASMTLEDVYERTRIRMEFLKGIEAGDYVGFPELIYIKGFIRTYLRTIGGEDLQEDFMAQLERVQPQKSDAPTRILGRNKPPSGYKKASHLWLFLVLLVALAGTVGYVWYAWSNGDHSLRELFSDPLARFSANSPSLDVAASSGDAVSLDAAASMDTLIASVEPEPEPEPKPEEKPKPSLLIRARNDVWMKVTIGGDVLFSRTLKRGDVASWDLPAQARVVFGRPNMAEVVLNGKELGVPNPKGSKRSEAYLYLPDGTFKRDKN